MKNISKLTNNTYAHRGYFDNKKIPENSIEAFRKAIRLGYNIELDVHITKDNKIVVFHDNNLLRMCGVKIKVEDCTYDELKKYKLLNTKYRIPLLTDVLKLVNGKVNLLIETKVVKHNYKLERELSKILDNYEGYFAIQSFNYQSINWFKKHKKEYIIGVLTSDFKNKKINFIYKLISKTLFFDKILNVDFIAFDMRALPNKYIIKLRKNKPVLGWTYKTKKGLSPIPFSIIYKIPFLFSIYSSKNSSRPSILFFTSIPSYFLR